MGGGRLDGRVALVTGASRVLLTTKGVKFTDGTPVNAEAVRFSLERFRKHSIGKPTLGRETRREWATCLVGGRAAHSAASEGGEKREAT